MTYQQQQKEPVINPPEIPIPPLGSDDSIAYRTCRYCGKPIIIALERISDSDKGKPRYRRVPRNNDGTNEIHNCLRTNNTLNQEGVN